MISPQGYNITVDPKNQNPFWDYKPSTTDLPGGKAGQALTLKTDVAEDAPVYREDLEFKNIFPDATEGQILEADAEGNFVVSDELKTVKKDLGDLGDEVNTNSGVREKLKGGSTGQYLKKVDDSDYNFEWADAPQSVIKTVVNQAGLVEGILPGDRNFEIKRVKIHYLSGASSITIDTPVMSKIYKITDDNRYLVTANSYDLSGRVIFAFEFGTQANFAQVYLSQFYGRYHQFSDDNNYQADFALLDAEVELLVYA